VCARESEERARSWARENEIMFFVALLAGEREATKSYCGEEQGGEMKWYVLRTVNMQSQRDCVLFTGEEFFIAST